MKKKRRNVKETSKKITLVIIGFGILDVQLAYILAFLDKPVPETVTVAIVTEIVATALGYFIKAFNSKKEEERMKYKRDARGMEDNSNDSNIIY